MKDPRENTLFRYFNDLALGERMITRGRTITEADLVNFANMTWDVYSLHTDAEFAAHTIFGERIAHGMMVLSYVVGLFNLRPGPVQAFYGIDGLRFTRPVKIGDTIHAELEVTTLERRSEKGGLLVAATQVKNQRGETVINGTVKLLLAYQPLAD